MDTTITGDQKIASKAEGKFEYFEEKFSWRAQEFHSLEPTS